MTVIVFSVNHEHVGRCGGSRGNPCERWIGVRRNCQARFDRSAGFLGNKFWWRTNWPRGHYHGFACGRPWRGETSRGGERRPPCVGTRVSPCTRRPKADPATCLNRRRLLAPR